MKKTKNKKQRCSEETDQSTRHETAHNKITSTSRNYLMLLLLLIVFGQYEPCSKLVDTALVQSDVNHGRISPGDITTMYKLPI